MIVKLKNSDNFLIKALEIYTSENDLVYLFNRTMRNIEKSLTRLSYLVGPMYYSFVRYLEKENQYYKLNKNMILYRTIIINQYDLNIYHMSPGSIICFPSFTSTSIKKGFSTTKKAKIINKINEDEEVELLIIFHYNHEPGYSNQGMILNELSVIAHEQEILLFPFTFIEVHSLTRIQYKKYELNFSIINKDSILEFGLKEDRKVTLKNGVLTIE